MFNRLKRKKFFSKWMELMKQMVTLSVPPDKLALSYAIGVFAGFTPYIGFQTYIGLALTTLFKAPFLPALIGINITNPITIPLIFAFTTKIGMLFLGIEFDIDFTWKNVSFSTLIHAGKTLLLPFIVGTHLVGIILSVFTYFTVYYIVKRYRKHHTGGRYV
ncbi:MAG: DUF2062 domain-containing protein [Deferribacteraceae bacterium]|jgi:uncharacterized protein (DUF2062 family)|nr:DUF2062 domain-containing protein [Deferribacteraceae bacterium]